MNGDKNIFDEFSSKIKKVYIELHNYSFFHGPSEISEIDPRFIGRKKIIERLKAILTSSESKSGAYLVTGQRGVGKSSFVSKAIDEISSIHKPLHKTTRFLTLFLLTILMIFLQKYIISELSIIPLIFFVISIIFLFVYCVQHLYDNNITRLGSSFFSVFNKKKNQDENIKINQKIFFKIFFEPLIIKISNKSDQRYLNFLNIIYILLIIYFISIIILYFYFVLYCQNENATNIIIIIKSFVLSYLLVLLLVSIYYYYKKQKVISRKNEELDIKTEDKTKIYFFKLFIEPIKKYFNYSSNIFIKINLGYDDLKEIDILRLIARNIKTKYNALNKSFRKNFFWRFFIFISLYIIIGFIYYQPNIYRANIQIKNELSIYKYLPSQIPEYLDDKCKKKYNNEQENDKQLEKKNCYTYNEYFDLLNKYYANTNNHKIITSRISSIISNIDYFIYISYNKIRTVIVEGFLFNIPFLSKSFISRNNFKLVPIHLDYLFIIYFILFWFLIRHITKYRIFNIIFHRNIINRLSRLNDIIDSQLTSEKGSKIGFGNNSVFSWFSSISRKNHPIADVKDIEKELLEIMEDIRKVPSFTKRPEFIFIFDELDKIEPYGNINIREKEEEMLNTNNTQQNILFSPEGTRNRQYALSKLFSNLKFFLTTAKAKFIFIAGREMYDAALADISDRNFFIGSIFHDVIYVDSFLSDPSDNKLSDITSMTEQYVCQFLLPKDNNYKNGFPNLKEYNKYLINDFDVLNENKQDNKINRIIARQKREKIIHTLQQFIIYLTHVSNGAPKKTTRFFENFIEILKKEDLLKLDRRNNLIVQKYSSSEFYLAFDYYDQYNIGMINYLVNPIILSISNTIKDYGDKLLVSSSFLVDHLFKFHRNAFSWRNIELAPEIIDINKTPELRNFITNIIQYLTQTHIQEIVSGLYDFKFTRKISNEIIFLSKISEESSAAFNFTLDESIAIKQHYQKVLKNLELQYKNIYSGQKRDEFVHSISSVHMVLGDLHFYDEEFGDAILEYKDSIQILRNMSREEMRVVHLVLLVRSMLKLGLAFEKRKSDYSAFITYGELIALLIEYRDINLDDIEKVINKGRIVDKRDKSDTKNNKKLLINVITQTNSKVEDDYFDNECCNEIHKPPLTPLKERVIFKLSSFEGISIIYQPLLAKLQVLEKANLGGITQIDIDRIELEFKFLQRTLKSDEKYLMESEFWNKVGNILYFKNSLLKKDDKYLPSLEKECKETVENIIKNGNNSACISCGYYKRSLENMLEKHIIEDNGDNYNNITNKEGKAICKLLYAIKEEKFISHRENAYRILADILSNFGDVYFSCSTEEDIITKNFLDIYFDIFDNNYEILNSYIQKNQKLNKLEVVLIYYNLSSYFYTKAKEYKENALQNTKILYFLKEYVSVKPSRKKELKIYLDDKENDKSKINGHIVKEAINSIYNAYDNIHFYEINRFKKIFSDKDDIDAKNISLNKTFINSDITEILIAYEELKNRCYDASEKLKELVEYNLVSPYILNDNIYNRILRLRLKASVNYKIFKKLGLISKDIVLSNFDYLLNLGKVLTETHDNIEKIKKDIKEILPEKREFPDNPDLHALIEYLITDSIYCLNEIIKISNIYGTNFMLNHSLLAYVHDHLKEWCNYYSFYLIFFDIAEEYNNNTSFMKIPIIIRQKEIVEKRISNINKYNKKLKTPDKRKINNLIKSIKDIVNKFNEKKNNENSEFIKNMDRNSIINKLEELIEEEDLSFITGNYQAEQAFREYYAILGSHNEGKAYKNLIMNMYYLNDDFNDSFFHFSIAAERYRINTGQIKKNIDELKIQYASSRVYEYENYLKTVDNS
ncbi:MAG: ATP-binding protein [Bacteroidales bacterium]|nr:ATP-binding protein [Bacteroidales bacterium]